MTRPLLVALAMIVPLLAGCAADAPGKGAGAAVGDLVPNLGGTVDQVVTSVFPGTYNFTGPYSRVLTPGTLPILAGERVVIASPIDGSDIEMGVFRPDTTERVPILVFSTPYIDAEESVTRQAGQAGSELPVNPVGTPPTAINPSASVKSLIENFVPHGYAVVTHSVRGTGGSDGCNDLMGPMEMADLDAAMTWLGEQDWSNGAIGMTGVSYDGSTPWTAAATGNPYVKTIIPISGVPDIYGLMYRNGSSEQRGPLLLNALYVQGSLDSGELDAAPRRLCPEAIEGLALSGVAGVIGNDPTGYWQARNRKPAVAANYKGSVLSVQGLQDWNVDPSQVVPWVGELEKQGIRTKQLLGQWGHAWPDGIGTNGSAIDCNDGNGVPDYCVRADWKEIMLRWMDQELKGLDVDTGAPVQVRDDLGRWRNELTYPPNDTNWTTYHLNHGALTLEPGPSESAILYPRATQDNDACVPGLPDQPDTCVPILDPPSVTETSVRKAADFALPPAATDLLVVGLPKVHITVTPQGPGGYMGATLIDRSPDGTERNVGWTSMNLAFADGSTEFTPVTPQQPIRAMMEIQPMDSVIEAGHQLVLRLWVITDRDRLPTIPPSPIALEMGGDVETVLVLPTVVRDEAVYFVPPAPAVDPDAE